MDDLPPKVDLTLSADEHKLLEAYDRLEQIRLECALLQAQKDVDEGYSLVQDAIRSADIA